MLQKSSMARVLEFFFIYPSKGHSLKDISKKVKLAHTSVKNNLNKLVGLNLILESVEKKGKRKFPIYKTNRDDKILKNYKIAYNLSSILESGLIEFIEEKLMPKSIVLFGSYRKGEDLENSDIDLFIECKEEELNLSIFEKKLGKKVQLHFKENFNLYPKELKNNILNGIVLSGFLEGYK
ncbi:MAG: nucleotidyltransferase domain-containing protein [Candidatus Pacearchaeota archaeon]|nr:nucleotidyltransferase domain-containing protein [Candidatus Pacearchaeota archaeon]